MRFATAVLGTAMALWASSAAAQARPDFSGKWTVDTQKTEAANPGMPAGGPPGGGRGGMGMAMGPMTLKLDATSFTTEREGPNGLISTSYKLDGSEQTVSMGRGEAKVKAMWEGDKLVLFTTRQGMNGTMTTRAVYALEGDWLVISTTMPGREGGEMTRKVYYKKGSCRAGWTRAQTARPAAGPTPP